MGQRIELQKILEEILGNRNVYFQPPASVKMKYPAIVYSRESINSRHANNKRYIGRVGYSLTLIGSSPESDVIDKLLDLPLCSYSRHYTSDNLNHDVFRLYY